MLQYRLACCHSLLGNYADSERHLHRAIQLDSRWSATALYDPDLQALRHNKQSHAPASSHGAPQEPSAIATREPTPR